jgi:potassium efflux system protein
VATPQSLEVPPSAEVEARIKSVESAPALDESAKGALLELYRRTQANIESARASAAKSGEYAQQLESAPDETAAIRKALAAPDRRDPGPPAQLPLEEVAQRIGKVQTESALQETRVGELDKLVEGGGNRPNQARARILELKLSLDRIDAESAQTRPTGLSADLAEAKAWELASRRASEVAELRAIEQELASQEVRLELYRARRDQAARELGRLKDELRALESAKSERRKAEALEARKDADQTQRESADKHPLIQAIAQENADSTALLARLADEQEGLDAALARMERELGRIEEDSRGARQRIEAAGLNRALGQILIDRRNQLPDLRPHRKAIAAREDRIAEATLTQIRNREEERRLRDLDQALAERAASQPDPLDPAVQGELKDLLEQRKSLLDKTLAAEDTHIRKLGELNDAAGQLIQATESFDGFLAEHLLWVRSVAPVGLETLKGLPAGAAWIFSRQGWGEALRVLAYESAKSPLAWLGWTAVALLLATGSALKRAILAAAEPLRRVHTDRFRFTLKAMWLTSLAALPLPLLLVLVGRMLAYSIEATDYTRAIGRGLMDVSVSLYFLRAFRLLCMPGGVADRHFRWSGEALAKIRGELRWFTGALIPVALVATSLYHLNDATQAAGLGRLALLLAMLGFAAFFYRLLSPRSGALKAYLGEHPQGWPNRLRNLWYPTVVAIPLALSVLTLMGYQYTAGTLFQALAQTSWLALGMLILQQTIVRWLMLTRRRLALQVALERQAARREKAGKVAEAGPKDSAALDGVEEPELDLATLDGQTRRLVNALVVFASLVLVWLIWSDLLPAFNMLEQFTLWHYQGTVDGTPQPIAVSAADMGLVLVILVVALVAARNLPALIEILLLQATSVSAGSRYAIKTLLSYAITAIALIAAFGSLGLSWSSVQWLVAALGVGIGFGLQEIVANFVSGLIILFERPVRVGDVVTIGETSGVVTNIQIRATTIRNWDKQELLVPNKELITGRLLNWTLTDAINRLIVNVGIEYGSDTDRALALLGEVAAANKRVLKDPPPLITFEGFGDNALLVVLRCYLDSVDYRLSVTSELHRAIDKAFAANGISIAFPQRDIHLSAREPLDLRLCRAPRADRGKAETDSNESSP